MKHFRNQQDHAVLNRHRAVQLLAELAVEPHDRHTIEPVAVQATPDPGGADSPAELHFATLCQQHGVQVPPNQQLKVELTGGDYTVADWAYPDRRLLIFIDGMSAAIHGNPQQQKKDKLKRAKAKMAGWHVVEISVDVLLRRRAVE